MSRTGIFVSGDEPRIHVDNTFGAAFIGGMAAAILYGVTCLQTYTFWQQRKNRQWYRGLILFLWFCDTFHLLAISGVVYFYLITNYANPVAIYSQELWAITGCYLITGVMEFTIRGMFTYRVWKLSDRNWITTSIIVTTSLVSWACNIAFAAKNVSITTFPNLDSIAWIFYVAFSASVVADLLTAVALWYLLQRRRTGFKKTDSLLKILIIYSVNTGALSSMCALLVLAFYVASPHTFLFVPFYYILPKVMLNSVLATLNASKRHWENAHSTTSAVISIPMSPVHVSSPRAEQGEMKHVDFLQESSRRHLPALVIDTHKSASDGHTGDSSSMDSPFASTKEHVLDLKYAA